ncbi:DNA-directed RNA polymerase III subunit RPC4 [Quillaja saponaria]|uniref:DNA-directed RNA polymerase III subunit RPC4 n=1 Tax=Quillaja saponaria TaxID=32244 RepID=A0AAD7L0X9_QUISA|nr:DNA-directed RNA polymerase III subunit RPC4 [Quillaja saponaria]
MDQDQTSSTPRKVRFAPKAPNRKKPKTKAPKAEVVDIDNKEDAEAQALIRNFNENLARRGPKVETKPSIQVAFGPCTTSQTLLRTYGVANGRDSGKSSASLSKYNDDGKTVLSFPPTANAVKEGNDVCFSDVTDATSPKVKEGYKEPWDYHNSYYPTTLPLRRPYSGEPEPLDEVEFGEAAGNTEYDENAINPAKDLGLLEGEGKKMYLFKLPVLPLFKQSLSVKGKEKVGTSPSLGGSGAVRKGCTLEELPGGYMGKMLVHKSGAIKLKLGETLYDVSPGSDDISTQDVMVINTAERDCCVLGELGKRAVVTPDVDHALTSLIDLS